MCKDLHGRSSGRSCCAVIILLGPLAEALVVQLLDVLTAFHHHGFIRRRAASCTYVDLVSILSKLRDFWPQDVQVHQARLIPLRKNTHEAKE